MNTNQDMNLISKLDVVWTTRPRKLGSTQRSFLDFVIDGVALSSLINVDFISPFGWSDADEQEAYINRLLGESPPDMPGGRTVLYVCPECGDVGCGAVTLLVQQGADTVTWKHFGFENDYEDMVHTDGYNDIGPFTFDTTQYHELFERIRLNNTTKEGE